MDTNENKCFVPKNNNGRLFNFSEAAQVVYAVGPVNPDPTVWVETFKPMPYGAVALYKAGGLTFYGRN